MNRTMTVVFIHGLFDDKTMWSDHASALAPDYHVVTPNILHEQSVEEAALNVLDGRDRPFAVVGFSMGGYIAFELMRRAPERISFLALVNTSARADTDEKTQERLRMIEIARNGGYRDLVQDTLPNAVHPDRRTDAALMYTLTEMAYRIDSDAFINQMMVIMSRPDSRPLLREITCPVLVIGGRQDTITPLAHSQEIVKETKGAGLSILERCGHYGPLEHPEIVIRMLQERLAQVSGTV